MQLLAIGLTAVLAFSPAAPASSAVTFALLGDTPYGDAQRAVFPALVDAINADNKVRMVLHAGDIKNGSSTCDNARFADMAALYNTFADPFVLTPGDNEWTDCHRTAFRQAGDPGARGRARLRGRAGLRGRAQPHPPRNLRRHGHLLAPRHRRPPHAVGLLLVS